MVPSRGSITHWNSDRPWAPLSSPEELAAFDAEVAPFERVRRVRRLAAIPRTALGKLDRRAALDDLR